MKKKSIFANLDALIEQAVASATNDEKSRQSAQEKRVTIAGLKKEDDDEKESAKEADDEEEEKIPDKKSSNKNGGSENAKKITAPDPLAAANSLFSDSGENEDESDVTPGTQTSKKLKDPEPDVLKHPDFQAIRNKINTLRGGGSLTKEPVKDAVSEYVGQLSTAEKSALLTYLTNLSQLMAKVKEPDEVKDPSKVGIDTKFKNKNDEKQQKDDTSKSDKKQSADKSSSKKQDGVIVVGEAKNGLPIKRR